MLFINDMTTGYSQHLALLLKVLHQRFFFQTRFERTLEHVETGLYACFLSLEFLLRK